MQEVYKDIHLIPVVLPNSPLKELNCFAIKGDERNLIVDTGFNDIASENSLKSGLKELNFDLSNTDIFLTHLHTDHSGLAGKLKTNTNKIYISEIDGGFVNRFTLDSYWAEKDEFLKYMDFPESKLTLHKDNPIYKYQPHEILDFKYVQPGEVISVGEYHFEVIDLSGHTPGQLGLYERTHGLLFGGDHILNRISPNITLWDFETDYLGVYLENLKKLKDYSLKMVFSSHRTLVDKPYERIDELLAHHKERLQTIKELVAQNNETVYKVSSKMNWNYGKGDFDSLPDTQKWFATSEVLAHLEHLKRKGEIKSKNMKPILYYV